MLNVDDATLKRVADVFEDVHDELDRQSDWWPLANLTAERWLLILGSQLGEAQREALALLANARDVKAMPREERTEGVHAAMLGRAAQFRYELVRVAAVAISAVECMDRSAMEV